MIKPCLETFCLALCRHLSSQERFYHRPESTAQKALKERRRLRDAFYSTARVDIIDIVFVLAFFGCGFQDLQSGGHSNGNDIVQGQSSQAGLVCVLLVFSKS